MPVLHFMAVTPFAPREVRRKDSTGVHLPMPDAAMVKRRPSERADTSIVRTAPALLTFMPETPRETRPWMLTSPRLKRAHKPSSETISMSSFSLSDRRTDTTRSPSSRRTAATPLTRVAPAYSARRVALMRPWRVAIIKTAFLSLKSGAKRTEAISLPDSCGIRLFKWRPLWLPSPSGMSHTRTA